MNWKPDKYLKFTGLKRKGRKAGYFLNKADRDQRGQIASFIALISVI